MTEKLCVTGMSGRLGGILRRALAADFELVALNRSRVPGVPTIRADLGRPDSIGDALAGIDAIVHLAAYPFADDRADVIVPTNVLGTLHLLEAARRAGVRRIVFGSSLSAIGGHRAAFLDLCRKRPFLTAARKVAFLEGLESPRPDSLYGVSKVFGEALCRLYVDRHRFSCVCLRLAEVRPDDRPNPRDPHGARIMCRHSDFVAGVRAAVAHTRRPGFELRTLISDDFRDPAPPGGSGRRKPGARVPRGAARRA
ncbi:MAG: NAD(P)-dependent oxidoreductase [Deltaproteobacteria bacterium]|nr:NAD(P)-dependent oxidoreductase [Deltaproteobacteria bacterium]